MPVEVIGPPVRPVPVATDVTPLPDTIAPHAPLAYPSNVPVDTLYRRLPSVDVPRWPVVPDGKITPPLPGKTGFVAIAIVGPAEIVI